MPDLRLFVALELPGELRAQLSERAVIVAAASRGVLRPVAAQSLHVTLCFLGSVAAGEVDGIASSLGPIAGLPAPEISPKRGIWLPPRRPRVLAVELGDEGSRVQSIQGALASALVAGGWYEPEERPFLPHVTLARVRGRARAPRLDLPPGPDGRYRCDRVTLFQSQLGGSGTRYVALASVELDSGVPAEGARRPHYL